MIDTRDSDERGKRDEWMKRRKRAAEREIISQKLHASQTMNRGVIYLQFPFDLGANFMAIQSAPNDKLIELNGRRAKRISYRICRSKNSAISNKNCEAERKRI